ncbi:hypothetical protein Sjap_001594 [Stephania japonica]|uniref:Uncharacterized protein n=1 Tax=Stephania japonica TaxID=461633 RepID=A0AAP0KM01_9MAGN
MHAKQRRRTTKGSLRRRDDIGIQSSEFRHLSWNAGVIFPVQRTWDVGINSK